MDDEKKVCIGSRTHIGRVRDLNEDSLGTPGIRAIAWKLQEQRGVLVAVADGMGGHAAGEVASQMAIETLFDVFYSEPTSDPSPALLAGFVAANQKIHMLASSDPQKSNMGSTLVAAVIKGNLLYVANVGDSRAYLIRGKQIQQITRDHSWVADQVRAHALTQEQAQQHVYKNIITRAIGNNPDVKIDLFRTRLKSNDKVLLCSDGLSNKVELPEIQSILTTMSDPDAAAQQLVQRANDHGGEDNVTVVVVRIPSIRSAWFSALSTLAVLITL